MKKILLSVLTIVLFSCQQKEIISNPNKVFYDTNWVSEINEDIGYFILQFYDNDKVLFRSAYLGSDIGEFAFYETQRTLFFNNLCTYVGGRYYFINYADINEGYREILLWITFPDGRDYYVILYKN